MAVVIEIEDDRTVASRVSRSDSGDDDDDEDTEWTTPKHENVTYAFIRSKQIDL